MAKRINYKKRNRITPILQSEEVYKNSLPKNYALRQGDAWAKLARDIVKKGQNVNRKINSISLKKKKPRLNKKLQNLRKQIDSELRNINNSSSQTANLIILRDKIDFQLRTNHYDNRKFINFVLDSAKIILHPEKPLPNL